MRHRVQFERCDKVGAQRLTRFGTQASHTFGGIIASQSREVDTGDCADEPSGLPCLLHAAPRYQRRGSPLDYLLVGGAVIGVSMPVFWLGVLLIYVFSMRLGVLPASGYGNGGVAYLLLPALTLALASTA